jgi:alkylation response protein AidB-like acyl-CoA dehydrogenase
MSSTILSRRDLDFLLFDWLDVEALTSRTRFADHSRETFSAAIDTAEQIATDLFAPHNKLADSKEPHFDGQSVTIIPQVKTALDTYSAAGLMAAGQDYELDGMQLPSVVEKAIAAWFTAANVSTSAYIFLTIANANTLLKTGTPRQVRTTSGLELVRHHHARRAGSGGRPRRRTPIPPDRQQDVDFSG